MRTIDLWAEKLLTSALLIYAGVVLYLQMGSSLPVRYILPAALMPAIILFLYSEFEYKCLIIFFLIAGLQRYFDDKFVITNFLPFIPLFLLFLLYRHPLIKYELNFLTVPFWASIVLYTVNLFSSTAPLNTFYMLLNYGQAVVVYLYLTNYINDKEDYFRLLKLALLTLLIPLIVGIYQTLFMTSEGLTHVKGVLNSRNEFAPFLAFYFFLLIGFFQYVKRTYWKVFFFVTAGITFWIFLNTYSRGALVGMLLAIVVFLFLMLPKKYKFAFPLVLVVVAVFMLLLVNVGGARFLVRFDFRAFDTATIERIGLWEASYNMFRERPVLGFGANTFGENYVYYFPVLRGEVALFSIYPHTHAHNIVMNTMAEQGLTGLILLFTILIIILKHLLSIYKKRQTRLEKVATPLFIAFFAYFLGHNMFDTVWHAYHHITLQIQLAVFFVFITGLSKIEQITDSNDY